jgi:hypothetical protein
MSTNEIIIIAAGLAFCMGVASLMRCSRLSAAIEAKEKAVKEAEKERLQKRIERNRRKLRSLAELNNEGNN